jgi:hypothetical protein
MPGQGEGEWGNWDAAARSQGGLLSLALTAVDRALAVESDRWFLWLPVFFAAGIIAYFALSNEPQPRVAAALVLGAIGICLALRSAPLGLALQGLFSRSRAALPRPSFAITRRLCLRTSCATSA